jgi:hypothetical protein
VTALLLGIRPVIIVTELVAVYFTVEDFLPGTVDIDAFKVIERSAPNTLKAVFSTTQRYAKLLTNISDSLN